MIVMPNCKSAIESMLEEAFNAGKKHRSAEILGLLGVEVNKKGGTIKL